MTRRRALAAWLPAWLLGAAAPGMAARWRGRWKSVEREGWILSPDD